MKIFSWPYLEMYLVGGEIAIWSGPSIWAEKEMSKGFIFGANYIW